MTEHKQHIKATEDAGHIVHQATVRTGFMNRLNRSLRPYRLGDLLTESGVITKEQLVDALTYQKNHRHLKIGQVLVTRGHITVVQLYRKLAEQWCLKASATGMALMMQTMTPSMAHADPGQQHVQLAAAFAPAAIKPAAQAPRLFGTTEIRSNNISAFTKWTAVMAKFERQMSGPDGYSQKAVQWKNELNRLRGKSTREKLEGVNNFMNSMRYIEDRQNWGQSDYWATPLEFLSRGGDCEDFAVAKFASLRALGFASDQMRIAIVQDTRKNIAHAVLVVYADDGTFILDNQDRAVRRMQDVTHYKPVYSINSTNWWMHRQPAGV